MTIFEVFRVAKLYSSLYSASGGTAESEDDLSLYERIDCIETELKKKPREWLLLYLIGDLYIRSKQLSLAIKVLEEAYSLRPTDIRSTFSLASGYRTLARAQFIGIPDDELFSTKDFPDEFTRNVIINAFDPEASHKELLKMGMTVDEAASKAMILFEETLRLGVRTNERGFVNECLQKMYADFPHLEIQVRNQIKPKYDTPLTRGSSGNIFYEAVSHYSRLRFLYGALPRYRYELGEVIRLCQWAITVDKRDGDVFVLLANAYYLLDTCVQSSNTDHQFYKRWAGAVIQYWNDSPLRQYPFTKNITIGEQLYENILIFFTESHKASKDVIIPWMKTLAEDYLTTALSPTSYDMIKKQLQAEPV